MSLEPACSLFCPSVHLILSLLLSGTSQSNFIFDSGPLVFVRATDDERVTVGFSPRIGGGDGLLVSSPTEGGARFMVAMRWWVGSRGVS